MLFSISIPIFLLIGTCCRLALVSTPHFKEPWSNWWDSLFAQTKCQFLCWESWFKTSLYIFSLPGTWILEHIIPAAEPMAVISLSYFFHCESPGQRKGVWAKMIVYKHLISLWRMVLAAKPNPILKLFQWDKLLTDLWDQSNWLAGCQVTCRSPRGRLSHKDLKLGRCCCKIDFSAVAAITGTEPQACHSLVNQTMLPYSAQPRSPLAPRRKSKLPARVYKARKVQDRNFPPTSSHVVFALSTMPGLR